MQGYQFFFIAIAVFAFIVTPILAIVALVRVNQLARQKRLDRQFEQLLSSLTGRIYGLEERLAQLSAKSREPREAGAEPAVPSRPLLEPETVAPAAPHVPPEPDVQRLPGRSPVHPSPPPPSPPLRATFPAGAADSPDIESVIAGKWLNYAGILAVLCAVAFFLKYAFDNNWVGPHGRVAIGLVMGAGLLLWSDRILRRGYRYFSEGIAALGAAVLYLSLWGGWHYYKLFEQNVAFAAMIVVTAAMIAIAVGRNSQRIAVMALAGGFLTPQLLSTGKDAEVTLFTYVLVLVLGLLVLQRARQWVSLGPLAFIATQIYFWGWFGEFYRDEKLGITIFFATLFFIAFSSLPVIRSRMEGSLAPEEAVIVPANALIYLFALHRMLWPGHRWTITFAVLALAAAFLLVLRALPAPRQNQAATTRLLFSGLALMCATLAVPLRLDGRWITIALAVEGAILVWSGFRVQLWFLRAAGLLLLIITAFRLLMFDIPAKTFIFNARFATFAVCVACYAASCFFANRAGDKLHETEVVPFTGLAVMANIFALLALSLEIWDALGRVQTLNIERGLAQSLGLSILWTFYATGLILVGLARKSAVLRWQALVLFAVVLGKVFLFDLSVLERFYRILSFLILGLLLLLVSFLYQRKLATQRSETKT